MMPPTRRQILGSALAAATLVALPRAARAGGLSASEIIARADEVRNPLESYFLRMVLENSDGEPWELEVSSQSNRVCLVRTLKPARERGRALLMVDENMWAYLPNLKRSVRVALNQKLVGQAANGDITRTRWSGDYDARIESETDTQWRVFLTANKKGLTYEKIRADIEKGTFRPVRAECLNLTGHPLKTLTYGKFAPLCGKTRPSEIVIADAIRRTDTSTMRVQAMELRKFPDSMFTPESLQ